MFSFHSSSFSNRFCKASEIATGRVFDISSLGLFGSFMIGFNIETLNAAGCVCSFTIQSNSLAIVDASFGLEQYLSISCDIPLSPMAFSLDKLA